MASVSMICCSYNRELALRETMSNKLAVTMVDEIIFVLDGSTDGSASFLRSIASMDPRLRVIERPHSGVQASRNAGMAAAQGDWLLMVDDDDNLPTDFVEVLLETATGCGAALVGAPWLHVDRLEDLDRVVADGRANPVADVSFRTHPSRFTETEATVPFMSSAVLFRADVARDFQFDSGFRGNGWREETDMFLRVFGAGSGTVRTPRTYSWMTTRYAGGHPRSPAKYEFWVAMNELRFLYRRRRELRQSSIGWRGWPVEYAVSMGARWLALAAGVVRTRARRVSAASRSEVAAQSGEERE